MHLAARSVDGAGRARVEVVRVRRVRRGVVRCIFVCEVGWRLEGGYVGDGSGDEGYFCWEVMGVLYTFVT